MSERVKVNVKVSSEVNTILHDLFNQIQYEFCEQYEEEIERLNNIIKEVRECLNKNRVYITGERNLSFEIEEILDKVNNVRTNNKNTR